MKPYTAHEQSVEQALLSALARETKKRVAERVEISDTRLGGWLEEHQDRIVRVIAACGLKLVHRDARFIELPRLAAILDLAGVGVESLRPTLTAPTAQEDEA